MQAGEHGAKPWRSSSLLVATALRRRTRVPNHDRVLTPTQRYSYTKSYLGW